MAERWNPGEPGSAGACAAALLLLAAAGCHAVPPPLPELHDPAAVVRQQRRVADALRARGGDLRLRRDETDVWIEHRLEPGPPPAPADLFAREIRTMTAAALMSSTALTLRYQVLSARGEPLWTLSARRRDLVQLAAGRLPGAVFLRRADWRRGGLPRGPRQIDEEGLSRWARLCGLPGAHAVAHGRNIYLVSPDAGRAIPRSARLSAYLAWAAGVAERAPEAEEIVILSMHSGDGKDGSRDHGPAGRLRLHGADLRALAAGRMPADLFLERMDAETFR